MVKDSLVAYVRNLIQKGYNTSAIRSLLLRYNYSNREIDDVIALIYKPTIRHEIHLSRATTLFIIFIFISTLGVISFFYFTQKVSQSKLLDLNLEPVVTTVKPGESISFLKEITNLGSSKRYDVVIKQEIIEPTTNRILTQKVETRAIETFGSSKTEIRIPEETIPGNYILRAIIEYDSQKAIATIPVKIASLGEKIEPKQKVVDCNDNNQCTRDFVENYQCAHKPIVPCCGNNICEYNEEGTCFMDCKKIIDEQSSLISTATLDDIKELAKVDPNKAMQQCSQIEVPDLKDTCISNIGEVQRNKIYCTQIDEVRIKDLCFSNVAKLTNEKSLCESISTDGRKDACYMTFALDNKDYSVCDKVTNDNLRNSCESLRQLNEQQTQNLNIT